MSPVLSLLRWIAHWWSSSAQQDRAQGLLASSLVFLDLAASRAGECDLDLLKELEALALITDLTAFGSADKQVQFCCPDWEAKNFLFFHVDLC